MKLSERRIKQNLETAEFKKKLGIEYEVTDNKNFDECFRLAWNYGHSAGFHEVESYFNELVELIK
jgi:FKBP-type peptidyl-prolyl cis-trans isomerase (trigger factor)